MATKTWQDKYSKKRRHRLMTEELGATIPPLYTNNDIEDYDTMIARAKIFNPFSRWTWYITEWEPETGTCFGLVEGFEIELGYFDLDELSKITVMKGVLAIERDLRGRYWKPKTLGEIRNGKE